MPPRRSHKKSRNGCDRCKQRRVKCDEAYPCLNCTRRHISCSYEHRNAVALPQKENKHSEQDDACSPTPRASLSEISARTDAALNTLQRNIADTACFLREWNGQDPELMHHYSISTYKTFSDREDARQVWQVEIPKIAYSYEFLMHGLLSVSALHLSYLKLEKQSHYLTSSTFHMALGLQTFRTILRNVTEENCLALFSFSSVIIIWICAAPTDSTNAQPLSSVIEMFNLCRGVLTLVDLLPRIRKSPLGPLMSQDWSLKSDTPFILFRGLDDQLTKLRYRLTLDTIGEEDRSVVEHAISELRNVCQRIEHAGPPEDCGMVCVWPLAVRSRFVSLIEQRRPFALTLLAFYCAQLHIFRHYWFVERRAETLLSEILTIMPPGYADLLEWPRRFCSSGPGLGGWGVVHLAAEGMSPSM
ncbi:hypothetical protein BDV29DRAFT_179277 [Aspergillus leporis]|uniref:Zn(2)-C6 fungal-type domain-containing protein n=1 Tax=Aspergillus leporis TaxID=41062 RepID=A0A5N5WWF0_9EURO|nr:hypothetical protein BDV29DRAFT_179277 [Aspergillus leporis]